MACLYTKCKLKGTDQQLICCWLCDSQAHLTCAGFSGRQFDLISDRSNGLRWSCVKCRAHDIDFYRMFKDTKLLIARMKSDFTTVMENFNKLDSLFDNFEYIEGSPKRKKSSLSVEIGNCNNLSNPSSLISLLSPAVEDNAAQISLPSVSDPVQNSSSVISQPVCIRSEHSPPIEDIPISSISTSQAPVMNFASVVQSISTGAIPIVSVPIVSVSTSQTPAVDYASVVQNNSIGTISRDAGQQGIHNLVVVPPRRIVFLSRLASDTTVDDIGDFIRSNYASISDDIAIFKFNYSQPRDISSFKISVPGKFFDEIVNKSFWPDGVLVREFVHRDRNRSGGYTRLSPSINVSKN